MSPTEYNIYPTSEIFAGSTDTSLNDFILNNDNSSPYAGDGTSAADGSSQPELYLEEQEPLIDPEITITTEVDFAGIDLESDRAWWDKSWWNNSSCTPIDISWECCFPTWDFDVSFNDDSSLSEDDATSSGDESSQPEFYLEEQEPLIHPEITITTEVDSAGIDLESDQTWWDESWWSDPSDTLSDTKRPTILPYLEDNTWSIPKAWWRGTISLDADSGESMEQPYAVSVALSTELLAPKFDCFSQEFNVSSQAPNFKLSVQELNDESIITTPVLFAYKVNITDNIELGLLRPSLLTFKTSVPNFTGDEPYSSSADPVASNNVLSPVKPMAADLLDETQRSSSGDDAMVGLNLLPDLEAILQGLINRSLRG